MMPHVENRITLGNVLSLMGTIAMFGGLLVSIAVWSGRQDQRIEAAEKMAVETRTTLAGHESRLRQIEQSSARQDERLTLILDTVREIKGKLERQPHDSSAP